MLSPKAVQSGAVDRDRGGGGATLGPLDESADQRTTWDGASSPPENRESGGVDAHTQTPKRLSLEEKHALGRLQANLFGQPATQVRLARYTLLDKLGKGGAGVVFSAYDPELDRKVAIKLLHLEQYGDLEQTQAESIVLREAQAAAKLSHPNVVAVYDVQKYDFGGDSSLGSDPRLSADLPNRGVFVVMEFIAGRSLRTWAVDEKPDWRRAVEVVREAGRGLAAAHAAGLTHRDFKPANVMVGDDGRTRVLDFGLARWVDEQAPDRSNPALVPVTGEQLLQSRSAAGTPAYMAPEQHAGEAVDGRADQFALCVALFEVLYGVRPFAGKTIEALAEAKAEGKIETGSDAARVPAWLRRVVLRGLEADPAKRFPSMDELVVALGRDPNRRLRWAAAGVGAAALAGFAWVAGAQKNAEALSACAPSTQIEGLTGAWDPERKDALKQAVMGTGLAFAAETWERVETGLDGFAGQWSQVAGEACELSLRGDVLEREVADRRVFCLEQQKQQIGALVNVLSAGGEDVVTKAPKVVSALPKPNACADDDALAAHTPPPGELRDEVERIGKQLAEASAMRVAAKMEEAKGVADAATTAATASEHLPTIARAELVSAEIRIETSEFEDARAMSLRSWAAAESAGARDASINALLKLATVVGHYQRETKIGDEFLSIAQAKLQRVDADADTRSRVAYVQGLVANKSGKHEIAIGHYERALPLAIEAHGPEHMRVSDTYNAIGVQYLLMGKSDEAEPYLEEALRISRATLGDSHPHTSAFISNLGNISWSQGKYEKAVERYTKTIELQSSVSEPNALHLAYAVGNRANGYLVLGDAKRALEDMLSTLPLYEKTVGKEHPDYARALTNLGGVLDRMGRHEEALPNHLQSLKIRDEKLDPDHLDFGYAYVGIAVCYYHLGKTREARTYFEKAATLWEKLQGEESAMLAGPLRGLAALDIDRGRDLNRAVAQLERALKLIRDNGSDVQEIAMTEFAMARALWGSDPDRAKELARGALAGYEGLAFRKDSPEQVQAWLDSHP